MHRVASQNHEEAQRLEESIIALLGGEKLSAEVFFLCLNK
jgi:hypothetical protein